MNTNSIMESYLTHQPRAGRILLVEDDPIWQAMLRQSIKSKNPNTEILAVSSVQKARGIIKTSATIDFVISDFSLEGAENGLDLWREFESSNRRAPFLLISGTSEEQLAATNALGANRPIFFSKARDIRNLRANLAIALADSKELYEKSFRHHTVKTEIFSGLVLAAVFTSLTAYAVNLHIEMSNVQHLPPAKANSRLNQPDRTILPNSAAVKERNLVKSITRGGTEERMK
jgi:CheY-like chemotaxis protein